MVEWQSESDLDSIRNSCDVLISLDWTFLGCSIFEEKKDQELIQIAG